MGGFRFHLPELRGKPERRPKEKCKTKVSEYKQVGDAAAVLELI